LKGKRHHGLSCSIQAKIGSTGRKWGGRGKKKKEKGEGRGITRKGEGEGAADLVFFNLFNWRTRSIPIDLEVGKRGREEGRVEGNLFMWKEKKGREDRTKTLPSLPSFWGRCTANQWKGRKENEKSLTKGGEFRNLSVQFSMREVEVRHITVKVGGEKRRG